MPTAGGKRAAPAADGARRFRKRGEEWRVVFTEAPANS